MTPAESKLTGRESALRYVKENSTALVLTGIPRSGTTLAACLVDHLEDTVCLNEPARYYEWAVSCANRMHFVRNVLEDLRATRQKLAKGGTVADVREEDGSAPTNYYDARNRRRILNCHQVGRPASGEKLLLAVKHNEPLTATLPELCASDDIAIVAIVRHPVPTILSWRSRPIPLRAGRLSIGYRLWPEALEAEQAAHSVIEAQASIYALYCRRYWSLRDRITIVRYEDMINNPGIIEVIAGRRYTRPVAVSSSNVRPETAASRGEVAMIQRALTPYAGDIAFFYGEIESWKCT